MLNDLQSILRKDWVYYHSLLTQPKVQHTLPAWIVWVKVIISWNVILYIDEKANLLLFHIPAAKDWTTCQIILKHVCKRISTILSSSPAILCHRVTLSSTALSHGPSSEEPACQRRRHKRHGFDPWVRKAGTAAHSSILAWRIPWTEEPGGLQSMGSPRARHAQVT